MSERNFETLEAGAVYRDDNGVDWFIVGKDQGGFCVAHATENTRGAYHRFNDLGGFVDTTANLIRKIEPKRVVWVNIYSGRENTYCTTFVSREVADRDAVPNARIARLRVEYTPGQFDS